MVSSASSDHKSRNVLPGNLPLSPDGLRHFRGFEKLTDPEALYVTHLLQPVHMPSGGIFFRQGSWGDAFYLLMSGRVEIVIDAGTEQRRVCAQLEPGSVFGEIGPLLEEPRTATAIALSDATLCRVSREVIAKGLNEAEPWATKLLLATARGLARRIGDLDLQIAGLVEALKHNATTDWKPLEAMQNQLRSQS